MASGGYGNLSRDWLANTLDPTPIFSLLVKYTYKIFRIETVFFAYYTLLLGIYMYSIFGIVDTVFDLQKSKAKTFGFLSLFMVFHAATIRFLLSTLFSPDWAYLFEGGVANQRVLGTVLQPSTFGVLLVLSIFLFLKRHAYIAVLLAALTATIHPTYLLTAGVLTATYIWITYREEKDPLKSLSIGAFAFVLVIPILAYVYLSFVTTPQETAARAREILVNFRLPHHAVISEWWNFTVILDIIFIVIALFLIKHTKLFIIILVGTLFGLLLTIIQWYTMSDMLALIFPWRISVILVPISISIIAAFLVSIVIDRLSVRWRWFNQSVLVISILVIALVFIAGVYRMQIDFSTKYTTGEWEMMSFVKDKKGMADVYLVPTKMQDFRLATGAPIYVDFKSIPYKDSDVIEWYRRQRLAGKFYRTIDCELLEELVIEDGVTHVIMEHNQKISTCPSMQVLYRNPDYAVYQILFQ
jgi:hypothetical protein